LLEDLRVAEERLRTMVESAQDYAIINFDLTGRVTYWNAGAERLLGYNERAIIGQPFDIMFSEDDRRSGLPGRYLGMALKMGHAETEGWRVREDGSLFGRAASSAQPETLPGRNGFRRSAARHNGQEESEERLA
jgi:PAS domain S-box-containing protein